MKRTILPTTSSRPEYLVCPVCESGELQPQARNLASCALCDCLFSGAVLKVLAQIAALAEAQGNHVAKILKKLELRSRAQLAAWATKRRLLPWDPD